MRSKWNSLVVGGCNVFGLALLALSATGGGSAVRAGDPAALQGDVLERIVAGIEQRVAGIEASIAAFADSLTARRISAQELCLADGSGAQTCITKAQLDALLKGAMQTGQAPAAIEPQAEQTASADRSVAAVATAETAPSATPAIDPPGAAVSVPQAGEGETQPEVAAVPEADAAREVATTPQVESVPQAETAPSAEAAVPSMTQPTTEQPTAALSEAAASLPAEATVTTQASEPGETVVAASGKPGAIGAGERAVKDEERAETRSTETTVATPEAKAAPTEAPAASERVE